MESVYLNTLGCPVLIHLSLNTHGESESCSQQTSWETNLQLWVLLVGCDNAFPLHQATILNPSNVDEQWNHLNTPAGGHGGPVITTLRNTEHNPMTVLVKERDHLLIYMVQKECFYCTCVWRGLSDSLSGKYYDKGNCNTETHVQLLECTLNRMGN